MLSDNNETNCSQAVAIVLSIRRSKDAKMTIDDASAKAVCKFITPGINVEFYQNVVDLNKIHVTVPPATKRINDEAMQILNKQACAYHPYHSQTVEHHMKLVTAASMHEVGFKRRDGIIQ